MAKWLIKNKKADIKSMCAALHIDEVFAQVLVNRGINTKRLFYDFINPSMDNLADITLMKDVLPAFATIADSIAKGRRIAIYGDYDVDGVMSTSILVKGLSPLGAKINYYIPHRQAEGYGLNAEAVNKLHDSGVELLILCDNGITALEEIKLAKSYGMMAVIIDHHEPATAVQSEAETQLIPVCEAVIDPKQSGCPYPYKQMCAAALCYRFISGFYTYLEKPLPNQKELLIMATIATFCDIVDLTGENRSIAYHGLAALNSGDIPNIGLKALLKEKNYTGKLINEFAIGFIIGPCINASGRLESAALSAELMLATSEEKAAEYAEILTELNDERKQLTTDAFEYVFQSLPPKDELDKVIVVYDQNIHESIAGIVAGRIKERLHHPAIVLCDGEDSAKGSARSIEGYNIFEQLQKQSHLFERFGGHAMAAGLSIKKENIETLRKNLNDTCELTPDDFEEIIYIDKAILLNEATFKLYDNLYAMRPFGKENKEPLMGTLSAKVAGLRLIDEKDTLIFTFQTSDNREIKGICFKKNDYFKEMVHHHFDDYEADKIIGGVLRNTDFLLDIVYYIDINEYNNNVSLQLKLKDFRVSKQ